MRPGPRQAGPARVLGTLPYNPRQVRAPRGARAVHTGDTLLSGVVLKLYVTTKPQGTWYVEEPIVTELAGHALEGRSALPDGSVV